MLTPWLVFTALCLALASDHAVFWRGFERRVRIDAARARHILWAQWAAMLWGCSALVMALWISQGLPASALGLDLPAGLRLWIPLALTAALLAAQASTAVKVSRLQDTSGLRRQFGANAAILPQTASELPVFVGLSLTAGFCEELLCRGFMIWLFQPFVGWWIGAALSLAIFTLAHLYQGRAGMARVAALGAVMTAIVFLSRSLWPAIVLHAAIDAMGGLTGWLVMRERVGGASAPADGRAALES